MKSECCKGSQRQKYLQSVVDFISASHLATFFLSISPSKILIQTGTSSAITEIRFLCMDFRHVFRD
jgi:hypothetical protein